MAAVVMRNTRRLNMAAAQLQKLASFQGGPHQHSSSMATGSA